MPNPWNEFWLQLPAQQTAMANEMVRQTMDFWLQNLDGADRRPQAEAPPLRLRRHQHQLAGTVRAS